MCEGRERERVGERLRKIEAGREGERERERRQKGVLGREEEIWMRNWLPLR